MPFANTAGVLDIEVCLLEKIFFLVESYWTIKIGISYTKTKYIFFQRVGQGTPKNC
jgi:hypothetical protein